LGFNDNARASAAVDRQRWYFSSLLGSSAAQDARGAVQYLKAYAANVGCVGLCMGGALALSVAANVQGHWADRGQFFLPTLVEGFMVKLNEAGVKHDFQHHLAHHAFGNEQAGGGGRLAETHNDPVRAQRAWGRMFMFFARHLA